MNAVKIIRNEDVEKVLIGVPKGHKHLRVYLKLRDDSGLIFQEATIANILRAYVTVTTHPVTRAQELKMQTLSKTLQKRGFARHQLLQTSRSQEEIEEELEKLLDAPT
jgi:predicted hydrolase (HD superfamily)